MIRVVVLEVSPLQCDLVAGALRDATGLEVTLATTDRREAVRAARDSDVLVVPFDLPDYGAERVLESFNRPSAGPRIVLTRVPSAPSIQVDSYESGAAACVGDDESMDELLAHVRSAAAGESLVGPRVAGRLVERANALAALCKENEIDIARSRTLTPREWEVLALLDRDLSNRELAERLGIAIGTVKNHVHSIIQKLGVSDRDEAALYHRIFGHREGPPARSA